MSAEPFDELLELENDFYKDGYDAGVADSEYAGMVEGKVFGIEKGYEKALELGKLHGRALVWQKRLDNQNRTAADPSSASQSVQPQDSATRRSLVDVSQALGQLPENARLRRHIESFLTLTDGGTIAKNNSDEAVSEFDDRISKAKAKAKIIANIAGESLNPVPSSNAGIEDATGLSARH